MSVKTSWREQKTRTRSFNSEITGRAGILRQGQENSENKQAPQLLLGMGMGCTHPVLQKCLAGEEPSPSHVRQDC